MNREALLAKAGEIADVIASSEALDVYWQAREKMERNKKAQELFEELKLKSNRLLVLKQQLPENHPKVMLAQLEINDIEEQLRQIPVAIQYKEAQNDVNELTQSVLSTVLFRLQEALPVERGPRQGCGQGHNGQGCDCQK